MSPSGDRLDRRSFLRQTAASAASATLAMTGVSAGLSIGRNPCFAETTTESPWKMKLSASSIAFSKLPTEEAVARIASLGFDAVDIWSAHACCPHLDDVLNRLGAKGFREILSANKVPLYSFSVYQGGYAKYAELLGQCGGGVAIQGSAGRCDPKDLTTRMQAFMESLKPLADLCEKYDSYLAIENHGNALLDSHDSFKAFVDLNTNKRLGIALAPYHLQRCGEDVGDVIRTAGDQLLYFYAWQHAPGKGQMPGFGPVDFTPWLAALAEIDYKWCVNPFMHHEPEPDEMAAAFKTSREYLLECHQKAISQGTA